MEPAMWPLNSLTLNSVDSAVCGALKQRVHCDDCLKLWNSWNRQSWTSGARCLRSSLIAVSMNGDDVWNVSSSRMADIEHLIK